MRNILITGANGFIGRKFVEMYANKLKKENTLLLVYGENSEEAIKNFKKLRLKYIEADFLNISSLIDLPHFDLIIHLAANTNTSKRRQDANNIGTKNLLESIQKVVTNTHIIYTSTTAIYAGRKDCNDPITDKTEPAPSNEYGRSKLKTEKYLIKTCQEKKFKLSIMRLCTVYGKNTKRDGLFTILKQDIRKDGFISKIDWPGLTSLVHVEDVAKALWMISKSPPKPNKPETYVLHSDSLSLAQISKEMHNALIIDYRVMKLPKEIWNLFSFSRRFISSLEHFLPYSIYNMFWRFSLIVDNALYCESTGLQKRLPDWKPKKFSEKVYDVVS